ncbi:unnamed protein product [Adineta ricciae]|uniref:Tyrosine-protein kinase n=1 Tax=Adineta ricciae TaxID=249248 RepID=A0A815GEA0_ADIRI|nr:unnamed protein product [Adineta ricciae]
MATKISNTENTNKDGAVRSNSKTDHTMVRRESLDRSPINCFFRACDREASEKLLQDAYAANKQKNGIYMLRQSKRDENKFILSLIKDGQCYHYRSHHAGNGTFLDEKTDSIFYSLDSLLQYYQTDGARHLRCPLSIPLRGQTLPAFAQRRGTTTTLHQAAIEGQRDAIVALLNDPNCPDIHSKNEEGNTPLHEACFCGRDDTVKELLQAGANWKFVNKLGWTSLHQAALGNCPTTVELLITRGHADVDARNPFNSYAPLHCAAACSNVETLTTLIAHDSPLRPLTENGETPYDLAIKHHGTDCVEKLAGARSKPAASHRSSYYHGSLSNNQMRSLLNQFKKHDGYFFVRQSSTVPDDYAISIIWQNTLVHVKLHKKDSHSYYFEDRLHYHDSLEHAIDYFMKVYKNVVKPLSPEAAKTTPVSESSQRLFSSASKIIKNFSLQSQESTGSDHRTKNPFNGISTSKMHDKVKMVPAIERDLKNPSVNRRVVNIREDQLKFKKLLGEGNFGKVYGGMYREDHGREIPVAIKALKATMDTNAIEDIKKETFAMKELSHPCIVRLYGVSHLKKSNSILMVQELLSLGSLLDYLKSHANNSTRSLFSMWVVQIAYGMAYMERKRFVHRDLAARNILMQSHSRIKISDFGLSRNVDSENYYFQQSDTPVPIAWYAPESLNQSKFTSKSDVWSFGVTMWEIYTFGQYPYGTMHTEEIYSYIASGGRLQRPAGCSTSIYDVIRRCWAMEAHDRPSFLELIKILANRSEYYTAIEHFQFLSKY